VFPDSKRKGTYIVLKGIDLENGVLRLPLRLVVSSKNIYGDGVKKKRVYCQALPEKRSICSLRLLEGGGGA
jgi:hypothetical protein